MKRCQPYEAVSAYLNSEITLLKLESLIIPNLLIGKGMFWPWSTKWSRAKTNRILPRKHTRHSRHPLPTTQDKTLHLDVTRWSIVKSDWRSSHTVSKTRLGADCGSDHECLIAKFRLKLKKAGTTQVWPKSDPLWLYSGGEK